MKKAEVKVIDTFDKEGFKKEVINNVKNLFRKTIDEASQQQIFQAVSYAIKDDIIDRWIATQKAYEKQNPKTVYYLSMEFLMGRALGNNMINLTCYEQIKEALDELGFDLNAIEDEEPDAALGNGGLGRLAACFLDSLATLNYPAYGCGIRYRYGMFKQKIDNGYQVEVPDNWLKNGYPWEMMRPEYAQHVHFGGHVECLTENGTFVLPLRRACRTIFRRSVVKYYLLVLYQCNRLPHTFNLKSCGFNLAQLYAETAEFDLIVNPAYILQLAVSIPATEVTGFVNLEFLPSDGNFNEALSREFRIIPITDGELNAAETQFSGTTFGQQAVVRIKNENLAIVQRPADRNGIVRFPIFQCKCGDMVCTFRGTVRVEKLHSVLAAYHICKTLSNGSDKTDWKIVVVIQEACQ